MFIYQRVLSIHIHPVGDPMDPWRYHSYHSYPRDPHLSWVSCQGLQRLVIHGLFCITHRETYQYITNKVYVVSNMSNICQRCCAFLCILYISLSLPLSMYESFWRLQLTYYDLWEPPIPLPSFAMLTACFAATRAWSLLPLTSVQPHRRSKWEFYGDDHGDLSGW